MLDVDVARSSPCVLPDRDGPASSVCNRSHIELIANRGAEGDTTDRPTRVDDSIGLNVLSIHINI